MGCNKIKIAPIIVLNKYFFIYSAFYLSTLNQARSTSGDNWYSFPTFTVWKNLYTNQTRVNIGTSHDYNQEFYGYSKPELDAPRKAGATATTLVLNSSNEQTHTGINVKFSSYNTNWFKLVFSSVFDDAKIHSSFNGYVYDSHTETATFYMRKDDFKCLDENGDCYLNIFGNDGSSMICIKKDYSNLYYYKQFKGFKITAEEFLTNNNIIENCEKKNLSQNLCNYVWKVLVAYSRGYGFKFIESLYSNI